MAFFSLFLFENTQRLLTFSQLGQPPPSSASVLAAAEDEIQSVVQTDYTTRTTAAMLTVVTVPSVRETV